MPQQRSSQFSIIPASEPLQVTTTGSAQTLTPPVKPANVLIMQNIATTDSATATNIHYCVGGTTPPSATVGFLLEDGDSEVRWDFVSDAIPSVKVFLAASSVLQYQWFISVR